MLVSDNLFDFFKDQVDLVKLDEQVDLTDDTSLYLAQLLAVRARTDQAPAADDTLAEMLARATQASPADQARTYREIGDRALYDLGFFEERLNSGIVGSSYYQDMGATAYHRADQVFKRWFADAFGPLFSELSHQFRECVSVLASIRRTHDTDDTAELYQEWLDTGSEGAAARLRVRGLVIPRTPREET